MMKRSLAALLILCLSLSLLAGCGQAPAQEGALGNGWQPERSLALDYATEFAVDYYAGGYKLLTLGDGSRFLVVPEGADLPDGIAPDIVPLYQPMKNLYLAASATMCLFNALDRLDAIRFSGTKAESWYIDNARTAMEQGQILFAGKYSQPDYEMLLDQDCPLAIESLMIEHAEQVRDKLQELGIAVLVDQSSRESHPLGRTEWIKLYGALLDREEEAAALFDQQKAYLEGIDTQPTGKTVAFFYINSSGAVVARKPGDYITKMIDLAGGTYVFQDLGESEKETSSVTMEMEAFFAAAKDADYIIYNSTIDGEVTTLDDLLQKSPLLAQMKAVQTDQVWCTSENMYQETTQLGQMIQSFHQIFSGQAGQTEQLPYLYRLH